MHAEHLAQLVGGIDVEALYLVLIVEAAKRGGSHFLDPDHDRLGGEDIVKAVRRCGNTSQARLARMQIAFKARIVPPTVMLARVAVSARMDVEVFELSPNIDLILFVDETSTPVNESRLHTRVFRTCVSPPPY